jgi:hypothetical protein
MRDVHMYRSATCMGRKERSNGEVVLHAEARKNNETKASVCMREPKPMNTLSFRRHAQGKGA